MEKGASSDGTKTAAVAGDATGIEGKTTEQRVTELETQLVCIRSGREEAMRYKMERKARPRQRPATEQRVAELEAQVAFLKAAYADAMRYIDMEEEDVVKEYRRAGKLHKYDPDKEWQKRLARVARVYPPPKHMVAEIAEYIKYLEEEEEE